MKKMNKKGFTIVELTIVIAVIAILAAVLIPTFTTIVEKANKSAVLQEATNAYKVAYTLDMSDGVQDYKDNETGITVAGLTYTSSKIEFTNSKGTATLGQDGNWTIKLN